MCVYRYICVFVLFCMYSIKEETGHVWPLYFSAAVQ